MKKFKCMVMFVLAFVMCASCMLTSANAAANPNGIYYQGWNVIYSSDYCYYAKKNVGTLWKYTDRYYRNVGYYRCLTYYTSGWITNNGQTLTITKNKTISGTVEEAVNLEVGAEIKCVTAKVGSTLTTSFTTSYSSSVDLTYDLSKAQYNSYKIAAMGYLDKITCKRYVTSTGKYVSSKTIYAYDSSYGYDVSLVYRW